ncbi:MULTISPECIES: metallophosphoesterase [unclassified Acinetobacter]|uniref:metallophosphoesterase family protein n=1 Tax=unclassified Acinetobacter TaxID=196816 RepID=UPI0015D348E0|nr:MULTISPECIES: metallophosphoesterase [unclassified Acinetobacter]
MILHLSDLHFGTEKPECMRAIQQFCRENRIEAVVASGDLTQRARYRQFYACKQFLESLKLPYIVVPGNHDIPLYHLWNRVFSPFARYQLFFGAMENVLETEHFYLIGINSIRRRYHTRGHVSLEQIHHVDELLKHAPPNKVKLIIAHQPFYTPPNDPHGVKDCPVQGHLALEQWSQHGLNGLLHGHLHVPASYDLNQIYALGAAHPVWDIHAGTATSYRLHDNLANSFNVIDEQMNVQHYFYHSKLKIFEENFSTHILDEL